MTHASTLNSRRTRGGFTLIEVMLAAVLGLIVILVAMGMFRLMDTAKQAQSQRMENNLEFASAHRIIQQAFSTLLMADSPEPKDDELKGRIVGDLESASSDRENIREENIGYNRFTLQPDPTKIDAFGRPMQTMELALKVPPVRGNVRSLNEAELREREQALIERFRRGDSLFLSLDATTGSRTGTGTETTLTRTSGQASTGDSRAQSVDRALKSLGSGKGASSTRADALATINAGSTSARGESDIAARAEQRENRRQRLRESSREFSGRDASEDAIAGLLQSDDLAPRAPGVRGVFELRPEVDESVLRRARASGITTSGGGSGLWAMWWREFPPQADEGADSADLAELARYSRSDVREVKLISGLRQVRWQVFRTTRGDQLDRVRVAKIAATHARELPAYVELKFETFDGRREHWMFELAWSTGPEPGSTSLNSDEGQASESTRSRTGDSGVKNGNESTTRSGNKNSFGGNGGGGSPSKGHTTTIDGPK